MTLFLHPAAAPLASIEAVSVTECMFCAGPLSILHTDEGTRTLGKFGISKGPGWERWQEVVKRCPRCGWWLRRHERTSEIIDHWYTSGGLQVSGAAGCLKQLDVSNVDVAIQTVRDYLMGRYEARFDVHPRKFEEVVASVYRDLGYRTLVTNYSGDDGIDVFMTKGSEVVGVQVKRYQAAIDVSQIRELAGALVLNDVPRGVFVTTSGFQRGAESTATRYAMKGRPIELVDADRFYSALELAQAEVYAGTADDLIAHSRELSKILQNEYRSDR